MSEVLITFQDGTAELRPVWCPCVVSVSGALRCPRFASYADVSGMQIDGRPVSTVGERRADYGFTWFWRIAGQHRISKALVGAWHRGRVESNEEQIERLTRERDAALARAVAAEAKIAQVLSADIPNWLRGDL